MSPALAPRDLCERLTKVSTATACWQLFELGIRSTYMKGLYPLAPLGIGNRVVGRAVIVRYLPFREDVDAAIKPEARLDMNLPIQCGGVLVMPGDLILADDEGVVVIPPDYAGAVAAEGLEQEALELFLRAKIEGGASLRQAYPPDDSVRAEYDAYRLKEAVDPTF